MIWILAGAVAFLLGAMPWGLWLGKAVRGIDVRTQGSGNLGATNVYRVLGPFLGIVVLLLDAGKGVAAVLLARLLVSRAGGAALSGSGPGSQAVLWAGLLGLACVVLGHSFSPFAGFHGGKGVAAAAGAWGVLAPAALALALGTWIVLFAARRIVSLASIGAAIVLPLAVAFLHPHALRGPIFWLAVLTAVLILARHAPNLRRLAQGTERPLALKARRGAGSEDS